VIAVIPGVRKKYASDKEPDLYSQISVELRPSPALSTA